VRSKNIQASVTDKIVRLIAMLVILMAFYVTIGRILVTYVDRYTAELEQFLSAQLNIEIKINELQGQWQGFSPKLIIKGVEVEGAFEVGHIDIHPSVSQSIINGEIVASSITISDVKITLAQKPGRDEWDFSSFMVKPNLKTDQPESAREVKKVFNLLDPLLAQDNIDIENFSIVLKFNDVANLGIHVEYAQLTSQADTKKISLQGWVLDNDVHSDLNLVAELDDWDKVYNGRIYLAQSQFDWSQWISYLPVPVQISKFSSELELWMSIEQSNITQIRSRLDIPEFELTRDSRTIELTDIQTEFSMDIKDNGYHAWLNDLGFKFQGERWKNSVHQIYWGNDQLEVLSDRLDAGLISQLAVVVTDNPALKSLAPSGLFLNSRLVWQKNEPPAEQVLVQGRFDDVQISSWQGIPGLTGLKGYIDMNAAEGFVSLLPSDAKLDIPDVFEQPLVMPNTQGSLEWHWSTELGLSLSGNQITTDIAGVDNLNMSLHVLASPKPDWDIREPRMDFQLSFDRASEERLADFLPLTIDRQSRQWVLDNVGFAEFTNAKLSVSIPTIPKPDIAMTMLLDLDINEGSMSFLPDWPDVTEIQGSLSLDSDSLNVDIPFAKFRGLEINSGHVSLPLEAEAPVYLQFKADGNAQDTLNLMTGTPLREFVDSNLDQWVIPKGTVQGEMQLAVPLSNKPISGHASFDLQDTDLVMPEFELAVNNIQGRLNWSDQKGIFGRNLRGTLFRHNVDFDIKTLGLEQDVLELVAKGAIDIPDLGVWFDDAMLQNIPGTTAYTAKLNMYSDYVDMDINTNLIGVALPFDYPLNKKQYDAWPLDMKVTFDDLDQTWINLELNKKFSAALLLKDSVVQKGQIETGLNAELPDESGVYFNLVIDQFNGDTWQETLEETIVLYEEYVPAEVTGNPSFDELIREITLKSDQILFFDEPWNNATVLGARTEEGWIASYQADEVQGTFGWGHEDDAPMIVDVDFAKVETDEIPEGEEDIFVDLLADYDPTEIPSAIIQVKRFVRNEKDMGGWKLQLNPLSNGVRISDIEGLITGVSVTANMDWIVDQGIQKTKLRSQATMGNMGDVLVKWNLTRDVMTSKGKIDANLDWNGSPLGFELKRIRGDLGLDFRNGAILNVDEDYDSLKLLSIFNFSLIMRRLAFDFRDVVQEGIGFDSITGNIRFDEGSLVLAKPIVVDGTSTKLKLGGSYDLIKDDMDFEMVFTIPLSSALPFAALIAGLSPQVAVAVFVTERLMNNELEKISSAKYEIKGSSKKPRYRLIKAFDNSLKQPKSQ